MELVCLQDNSQTNYIFSEVNVIINQSDFDCININGFKKLNGNQILSEDISYILNDVKDFLKECGYYVNAPFNK